MFITSIDPLIWGVGVLVLGFLVTIGIALAALLPQRGSVLPLESGQYDYLLQTRMAELDIPDWQALQRLLKVSQGELNDLRSGQFDRLPLGHLLRLADLFNWSTDDLWQKFGLSNSHLEIQALRQAGLRLQDELQQQRQVLAAEFQREMFQQIQPLLTNYPSLRPMVLVKPDLPAKNFTSLFTSLDNLISGWGIEPIGVPWELVDYDPQLHQPDGTDFQPGESVYIRFVGYRQGNNIWVPAKVSRTLPTGVRPNGERIN